MATTWQRTACFRGSTRPSSRSRTATGRRVIRCWWRRPSELVGTGGYYALLLAANALLGALTCGLVVLLGALCLPLWGAALAGLLLAFSPHHISLGNYVLSETLFGFTLTACLYLLSRGLLSRRAATLLGAGAFGALAWATNPVFAVLPVLVPPGRGVATSRPCSGRWWSFVLPLAVAVGGWQARTWLNVPADARTVPDAGARQLHHRFASGVHCPVPRQSARSGQCGESGHRRRGRLLGRVIWSAWGRACWPNRAGMRPGTCSKSRACCGTGTCWWGRATSTCTRSRPPTTTNRHRCGSPMN